MMTSPASTSLLLTAPHRALLVEGSAIAPPLVQQRGYQSLPQPEDLIDRGFSKAQAKTAPPWAFPSGMCTGSAQAGKSALMPPGR